MTHIVNDVIKAYLKGLGENIIDIEKIKKQFEELGLEHEKELSKLRESIRQFDGPRIIVKDNQFNLHCDKSYLAKDISHRNFEAIVIIEEQFVRALWDQEQK